MCVASFDSARTELYLGREDKSFNKKVFDHLYAHKAQIEQQLGTALSWNRGEDKKLSKIVIEQKGLSINNEADWAQVSQYHAEWSKKFYDVMTGYVFTFAQ